MRRILGLAVTGIAVAVSVSACGGSSDPNAQSSSSPSAAPATTSSKAPVNRPKQLKLDGVDPCSLLTPAQQQIFKVHATHPGTDEGFQSPKCDFNASGAAFRLTTVTNAGAEGWTAGKYKGDTKQEAPVEGFPTLSNTVPGDPSACDVVIDTADGQFLLSTARILGSSQKNFPEKCAAAHQLADEAVKTLLASH